MLTLPVVDPYSLLLFTLVVKHYELWWRAISIPRFYIREVIFVLFEEANDFWIKHQLSHAYFNNCAGVYKLQYQAPEDIISSGTALLYCMFIVHYQP